ncbi:ubiquinol-cytochrome c reductase iron-sulfur subunit [Steroidobacter sp. S1-65]|uniref:Ubiquinol-cytochrome c reductase iron-sulfur subunit n=1 Tax=Steroidobacter gossypii TaxID=2805490 RepID=A0ABS1X404_9GAMM|nr:ubiquinol-cytochrome c reductase iron-sulfur subunit [Steroidobacter gossypii]MBM0107957.1 ubiquinol-cytochrome c reductase iron-sulfur subunit [Steroidobacter gossypii]
MTSEVEKVDGGRRHFLLVATAVTGIAGAAMTAVPFLASWKPSARAQALGAPVEQDISKLEPGAVVKVNWRGQAIFIVRRSPEMMKQLEDPALADKLRDPKSEQSEQPEYAKNDARSLKPEYLVLVGVCTHLGCAPLSRFQPADAELGADWPGGFYCPCHGSKFDLAGRVFKDVPAPTNLKVPPYRFVTDGVVQIGVDAEVA